MKHKLSKIKLILILTVGYLNSAHAFGEATSIVRIGFNQPYEAASLVRENSMSNLQEGMTGFDVMPSFNRDLQLGVVTTSKSYFPSSAGIRAYDPGLLVKGNELFNPSVNIQFFDPGLLVKNEGLLNSFNPKLNYLKTKSDGLGN